MKIQGLDGKNYSWTPKGANVSSRSSYHILARKLITEIWPANPVLEEVFLPGSYGLSADFIVFGPKIILEVHGEQHYQFSPFFHESKDKFILQQNRDIQKQEWCNLNSFTYIELPYNESENEWRQRINRR